MKNPSRRAFLQQIAMGSLTTPLLLKNLTQNLSAQPKFQRKSLFWIYGQSSAINLVGTWNLPDFPAFLDKYFQSKTLAPFDASLDTYGALKPIVILDGYFNNHEVSINKAQLEKLLFEASAVVLLGNEASYGPSKTSNWINLENEFLALMDTPYIKLPGVPVSARHLLGTLNHLILFGIPEVDENHRPLMFFDKYICVRCEYRSHFEAGDFVNFFGEKEGCLYLLGCKGPTVKNSCPIDRWNETTNWCVKAGSPCSGCSEPSYPDHSGLGLYGIVSANKGGTNSFLVQSAETIAKGALAVTTGGVLLHAISRKNKSPVDIQIAPTEDEEV